MGSTRRRDDDADRALDWPGASSLRHNLFGARMKIKKPRQLFTNKRLPERAEEGTSLVGRKTVLRQSFYDSPKSFEPRRGINPRVAGASKWSRIETLQRMKHWLDAYRIAWLRFASGIHDAIFPAGTWAMRLNAGAHCAPVPDPGQPRPALPFPEGTASRGGRAQVRPRRNLRRDRRSAACGIAPSDGPDERSAST